MSYIHGKDGRAEGRASLHTELYSYWTEYNVNGISYLELMNLLILICSACDGSLGVARGRCGRVCRRHLYRHARECEAERPRLFEQTYKEVKFLVTSG